MTERPVFLEPTAREIAQENFDRFGKWLLGDELTTEQKMQRLLEVFAHIAHDGLLTRSGLIELTTHEERVDELLLEAEVRGYMYAITDIDEGQGE